MEAPRAAEPLLAVAGLSFGYRGRPILAGVDLALEAGRTLALLGPNGAGKTSLMRLAAGRLAPAAGSVRVAGRAPHRDRGIRRAIGWVPQEIALYPRLTVAENLDVFAALSGLPRRDRRAAVAGALALADLAAVAGRPVGELSGGFQRRANIAAGLIGRPRLVLLDEPTQGVDLEARAAIHATLARLRRDGTAILIATHDFAEAERLADRVAVLAGGRIRRAGALPALLAQLRAGPPEHEVVLGAPPGPAAATALRRAGFRPAEAGPDEALPVWRSAGSAPAADGSRPDGAALLAWLAAQGVPAAEVRVRTPGLEALYREALASDPAPAPPVRRAAEAVP